MPRISSTHRVTLPADSLKASGLRAGDDVTIEVDGPGRVVIRRVRHDVDAALGVFDGLYDPAYLDRLRAGERA
ncbi:AbrB/MazE/SpoVT family DNA-binding domain-containing protein [Capillimicrobium parvum]|uniref:AbrB/MazE/SpoVT family DNA-binding domain-containing protein n=1 Tax=Capillimicrobium parvum TaxID=2884022 RepID=UPI00216ABCF7|nr:AbrB/MazE/SpoVT family DNA-binding domain-containing protein [Capillimicrobium parvum]